MKKFKLVRVYKAIHTVEDPENQLAEKKYIATCPSCGETKMLSLASIFVDFEDKLKRVQEGELIQDVFKLATTFQREQALTGICSERCWLKFLDDEEE